AAGAPLALGGRTRRRRRRGARFGLAAALAGGLDSEAAAAAAVPLTRDLVAAAVDEYGAAWVAQDPGRIARLFTEDAVYIERPFDRAGTFRGGRAIRKYWATQIVGKQANIVFRHVRDAMVVDAQQGRATVKWLAEFDNLRFEPGKEQPTRGRIRFVQV
ncbi:unnamed protein product, partial [Prorocentrum cordatum]